MFVWQIVNGNCEAVKHHKSNERKRQAIHLFNGNLLPHVHFTRFVGVEHFKIETMSAKGVKQKSS